ncbi:MAG: hypothetical protein M3017_05990 [Actinomycetota bacterium]|nr:hypothetical protein [Actinomycetota bacterium]
MTVHAGSLVWVDLLEEELDGSHSQILTCRLEPGGPEASAYVANSVAFLFSALRGLHASGAEPRNVLIVISAAETLESTQLPGHHALVQAARGIVQSMTLEKPAGIGVINVISHKGDGMDDIASTVRFLDSPGGGYLAGSWIGLDQAAWPAADRQEGSA